MNYLIAKVKNELKNVLSQDVDIIELFRYSDDNVKDYSSNYKLDEDEWFKITEFSRKEFFNSSCSSEFSTASLNQIENADYSLISSIYLIMEGQIHFQRITPSLYLNKKTLIDFSGEPKIVKTNKQLEIKNESDAIYMREIDTLIFKNLSKIKTIFPGIEVLHREASKPEVEEFLSNKFIFLKNFNSDSVGVINRKRIADIGAKYNNLNKQKQDKLINYAKEKTGISIENDAFKIDSDINLKNLLYALDQRYYYADIYEENRIANSVLIVKN